MGACGRRTHACPSSHTGSLTTSHPKHEREEQHLVIYSRRKSMAVMTPFMNGQGQCLALSLVAERDFDK